MITYIDTSTFVKLLIVEKGTSIAETIWNSTDVSSASRLLKVEAHSTLAHAHRIRRLTVTQFESAKRELKILWARLTIVEMTSQIVERACEFVETMELRALDAVHLASAIAVGADVLTSADRKLCIAARTVGLHVINPLD